MLSARRQTLHLYGVGLITFELTDGGVDTFDRTLGVVALRRADAVPAVVLTEAAVAVKPASSLIIGTHT